LSTFFRIAIACLLSGQLLAQADTITISPYKSIHLSEIAFVSTDNLQNIIVADKNGGITAINYIGEISKQSALDKFASISTLDASYSFNILIFYKDLNQCIFADRLLRPISEVELPNDYALAASANNGDLWLFNENRYTIDKYSPVLQQTISELPLQVQVNNESVVSIKEYDHLLTVSTKENIYFFSLTGELKQKVPIPENAKSYLAQGNIWILQQGIIQKKGLYKNSNIFFKIDVSETIEGFVVPENKSLLVLYAADTLFFIRLPGLAVE